MIKIDMNEKCYTDFENEEYFPIVLLSNEYIDNIRYVEYVHNDDFLLEFTLNKNTNKFYRLKLILCKEFRKFDDVLDVPDQYVDGTLEIDEADKVETSVFTVSVFQNGVSIKLSETEPAEYYRNGQLYAGVDTKGALCVLKIGDLNAGNVQHILKELSFQD